MTKNVLKYFYFFVRDFFLIILFRPIKKEFSLNEISRILVIRIDRIGDLVLSTPIFKILKKNYPDAKIDVLIRNNTIGIIKNNPYINEIFFYDKFIRTVKLLRKKKYDLIIDLLLEHKLKTAFLTHLLKPKNSIGFDIKSRGRLFTFPVKHLNEKKHFIDATLDLLKPLNIKIDEDDKFPELFINNSIKEELEIWLKEKNINKTDFLISAHPGGYYPSQRWPWEKFSLLINKLFKKYKNIKIFLFGNKIEENIIENIIVKQDSNIKQNIFKIVDFELDKVAGLIQKSKLFIGNNSGLLHIATAVKTPTISFMGPTVWWLWWPYGEREKNIVIRKNLKCSPCNKGICKDHKCMELISVDEVLQAVNQIIK